MSVELGCRDDGRIFPCATRHSNPLLIVTAEVKIEEELVPGYRPEDFYLVKLGKVLNARYQAVPKLGCGFGSVAWLCQNMKYSTLFLQSNPVANKNYTENRYWTPEMCTVGRNGVIVS